MLSGIMGHPSVTSNSATSRLRLCKLGIDITNTAVEFKAQADKCMLMVTQVTITANIDITCSHHAENLTRKLLLAMTSITRFSILIDELRTNRSLVAQLPDGSTFLGRLEEIKEKVDTHPKYINDLLEIIKELLNNDSFDLTKLETCINKMNIIVQIMNILDKKMLQNILTPAYVNIAAIIGSSTSELATAEVLSVPMREFANSLSKIAQDWADIRSNLNLIQMLLDFSQITQLRHNLGVLRQIGQKLEQLFRQSNSLSVTSKDTMGTYIETYNTGNKEEDELLVCVEQILLQGSLIKN